MPLDEFSFSLKMRDIVQKLVSEAVDTLRPKYRYGKVSSIDRANFKAGVIFNGETGAVLVNMGGVQPSAINQTVRVEGIGTDKFITDVIGSNVVVAGTTTGTSTSSFDPTGATDCTAAINAAIASIKVKGGVIEFAPGTYRIDGQLVANDSYNVTLRGTGPQGADRFGPWYTTLQFTKATAGACLTARQSQGFTIDNLALINTNASFTSEIVNVGSVGDPTPTYRPTFRNGYIGGASSTATNALTGILLGQSVEAVIDNMVIGRVKHGVIGRWTGETIFSNAVTIYGGRFVDCLTSGIYQPGFNWVIINTVFEPTPSGAPAGIVCTSAFPAKAMTLVTPTFWDATVAGVWCDLWGTAFNFDGVYAELNANGTLYRLNGGVWGFRSVGGYIWGGSGATYIAVANSPQVTNFEAGDGMAGGILDNQAALAPYTQPRPNYMPTMKKRVISAAGTYNLSAFDAGTSIFANASGGAITINPPDPSLAPGAFLFVKKADASANTVMINGFPLTGGNAARLFISDGTAWHTASIVPAH